MRSFAPVCVCLIAALLGLAGPAHGTEQIISNDQFDGSGQAGILGDFVAGEMAAAVLTSPCNGTIVGVQILWIAAGGAEQTLQENIWIYNTGTPSGTNQNPGPVLLQLEGPVMSPGFLNEFRYVDESSSIPINVPVTSNQKVTVAFEFGEDTHIQQGTASVTIDTNGCQNLKNYIYGTGFQGLRWYNACQLGVSGDIIIRAIVDCPAPSGACCDGNAVCTNNVLANNCTGGGNTFFQGSTCGQVTCPSPIGACCNISGGCLDQVDSGFCAATLHGYYAGNGTACDGVVCDPGACCKPDGSCQDLPRPACVAAGGVYEGGATTCSTFTCPQPRGACCVDSSCVSNQTQAGCSSFFGIWNGANTTCTPNPCNSCASGNADGDTDVDLKDFAAMQKCFNHTMTAACDCVDMNNDNLVNLSDLPPFSSALNGPQ